MTSSLCKATWIIVHGSSDIYWRCELPASQFDAKLIIVPKDFIDDFKNASMEEGDLRFRWQLTDEGADYPDVEGTVVFPRPDQVRAWHGAAMSANGHRVIAEVDDNFLSNPNQNIFMTHMGFNADARTDHMHAFASMDAIVFSTAWLRDHYRKTFLRELRYVPELYVARNHVDDRDARWQPQERPWGKLRVGIQGSYQHVHDWKLAARALHLAVEMGCEVVFMGLDPGETSTEWKRILGEYTHLPWAAAAVYHQQHIPFDIGLAPLLTTEHTLGKSDVKALEYAMSGVASVLQNNSVYNREWRHGDTALLAGSPEEFERHVKELILNSRFRRELVERARDYVRAERTIQGNRHEWEDALRG